VGGFRAPKHMPMPNASSEQPAEETRDMCTSEDRDIRCLHCKGIIAGHVRHGLCVRCASCVRSRCGICSKMIVDTDAHMGNHSKKPSVRCGIVGCKSTRLFTKAGVSMHKRKSHREVFNSERTERRKRKRNSSRWLSKPGGPPLQTDAERNGL
jgi:hypothetical protein